VIIMRAALVATVVCDGCHHEGIAQHVDSGTSVDKIGLLFKRQISFVSDSALPNDDGRWRCTRCRVEDGK